MRLTHHRALCTNLYNSFIIFYNSSEKPIVLSYNYHKDKPKKAGTSTVSFKYKQNGKTKKCSFKVKAFKYTPHPFKSFKFGSKRLDTGYNEVFLKGYTMSLETQKLLNGKKDSQRFVIKLKKGWKLKSATLTHSDGTEKKVSLTGKTVVRPGTKLYFTFADKNKNEITYSITGGATN